MNDGETLLLIRRSKDVCVKPTCLNVCARNLAKRELMTR